VKKLFNDGFQQKYTATPAAICAAKNGNPMTRQ
jgi:hypothetical protein